MSKTHIIKLTPGTCPVCGSTESIIELSVEIDCGQTHVYCACGHCNAYFTNTYSMQYESTYWED